MSYIFQSVDLGIKPPSPLRCGAVRAPGNSRDSAFCKAPKKEAAANPGGSVEDVTAPEARVEHP